MLAENVKVSKGAKIRNRYNQVPHLTQDISGSWSFKVNLDQFQAIVGGKKYSVSLIYNNIPCDETVKLLGVELD